MKSERFWQFASVVDTSLAQKAHDAIVRAYDAALDRAGIPAGTDRERAASLVAKYRPNGVAIGTAEHDLVIGQGSVSERTAPAIIDLITELRLVRAIQDFLGGPFFWHLAPSTRCILPGNSLAMVPAHYDYSYNKHYRRRDGAPGPAAFFTAWIPLVPIDNTCRGLEVFDFEPFDRDRKAVVDGLWVAPPRVSTEPRRIIAEPGDVVIFSPDLLHQSGENLSQDRRVSMDVRFFPASTVTSKWYLDPITKTKFEPGTGPNASQ
jgi:hypothetical protein